MRGKALGSGSVVFTLALAACGGGGGAESSATTIAAVTTSATVAPATTTTTPGPEGPPYRVETSHETFVDRSRPTPAGAETPAAEARTLVTTIHRPVGGGPFPLVVFAHGLSGHPDKFDELLTAWAEAGYVVAAPAFPLTNSEVPASSANAGDVANQDEDISFVIGEVLRLAADPASALHGAVDPDRIGAAGLSLGGATTYNVAFSACCRDQRLRAAAVLNGLVIETDGEPVALDGHIPLLIAHSDTDPALPYQVAVDAYERAAPPVWLVTLTGAGHAAQWEDDPTPWDEVGERLTTAFWDATLGGDPAAFERLEREATVEGLSAIVSRR